MMKMKEAYTDDFGNLIDKDINLGLLLRQRLEEGMIRPIKIERKKDMNKTVDETLEQRGNNYGNYRDVAYTAQELKKTLRYSKSWHSMEPYMQESLDMICNKAARIVNGNPYYDDSWHDICGYATLVEKQLEKK
jgi:hypothetical protein